jgi:hypothetical protein
VVCAAKDETSVDIMGRMFCCNFLRKISVREPLPGLNTKKCAGEKHYLSDCSHTVKDESIVLLSEYKKKRNADKKKGELQNFGQQQSDG